jgi:hypothetical protein
VNPLFKRFSLDSKGLCVAWHNLDSMAKRPSPTLSPSLGGPLYLNPQPV